mgnify:FL=1
MNTLTQLLAAIFTLFVGLFSTQTFAQNNAISPTNNISVTPVVGINPNLFVTGTITGSITVPKQAGSYSIALQTVKTHIQANLKATRYDLVNGSLVNPQNVNNIVVTVTEGTHNSTNYVFNYTAEKMPLNRLVKITIADFIAGQSGLGGTFVHFDQTAPNMVATMTSASKTFAGYHFRCNVQQIPY